MLWAGDTRRKLLVNISAFGGSVALVTATAPGRDLLPWDTDRCSHAGDERCSGKEHGCQVQAAPAHDFNAAAPESWRAMHRRAAGRARYYAKKHGGVWRLVAREWEFQRRGVLHMHAVVPMATGLDRRCSQIYADALDELAGEHGWGNVDQGRGIRVGGRWIRALEVIPQDRAARYLAKYIAGVDGSKLSLSATVTHPDVPPLVTYVARELTTATRCTMRSLREVRRNYCWGLALIRELGGPEIARLVLDHAEEPGAASEAIAAIRQALGP